MSVGGIIIDIVVVAPDKWWVDTVDRNAGYPETTKRTTVAIFCDPEGNVLEIGDSLWWQSGVCYWTSHKEYAKRKDVPLKKIGYSGVPHPDLAKK